MKLERFDILKFKSRCLNCGLLPMGYTLSHGSNNECRTLGENRRDREYYPSDNLEYLEYKYEQLNTTI